MTVTSQIVKQRDCICLAPKAPTLIDITNWKQDRCNCKTLLVLCQRHVVEITVFPTVENQHVLAMTCIINVLLVNEFHLNMYVTV